jgi:hypothetical protein
MSDPSPGAPFWEQLSFRGWLLLAGAVALIGAGWVSTRRSRQPPPARHEESAPVLPTRLAPEELSEAEADREAAPVAGYRREVVRPRTVQNLVGAEATGDDPQPASPPGGPSSRRRDEKKTLPEIFRMPGEAAAAPPAAVPAPPRKADPAPALPDVFAPFGRLVKCELLETIDSITARSEPILALVTEDVAWNGNVIIPAGSEAFSYAAPEPVMDGDGVGRLVDNGEWTLVLPGGDGENGRELALKGRAVNRLETVVDARGRARSWGIDDGADGLVGYTLSSLDDREIRLFVAAAASGLAQGFGAIAEHQVPATGVSGLLGATQVAPTVGNAVVGSVSTSAVDAANEMVARIRQEIAKRGTYVRVPAGKPFYLFVEQTIDPRLAQVGLRLPPGVKASR